MSQWIKEFLKSGAIISLSFEMLLIGWGQAKNKEQSEVNLDQPAFYFSDFFFKKSHPWIQYSQWMTISVKELNDHLKAVPKLSTCDWMIHQPEKFKAAFHDLWQLLQKDRLQKAVPYLFAKSFSTMSEDRLQNCLKRSLLFLDSPFCHLYGYWSELKGVLGITPELLFSHSCQQPQKINTMALAGTCHPSESEKIFLENQKELHEHQLVIQGICQSLQFLGNTKVGSLQLLKLPKLTHLMTPIELELNQNFHFESLVKKLHPTPALGAFPTKQGRNWLENYEKHIPRHHYGSPLGFIYHKTGLSKCLVGIRNVQWDASGMRIGVGCGVVKQSLFEKEWQEIQFKIRAVRDQLYL